MMNFIKCPVCSTPLSLNGDERIKACSVCGAKVNTGLAKLLYATAVESIIKNRQPLPKNLQTNVAL